jgi:formate-nitrite transporter family protein
MKKSRRESRRKPDREEVGADEYGREILELRESEIREIEKRATINAVVVHEVVRQEGEDELARHPRALMWSGLAAGLSMGFSFLASVLLNAYLPGSDSWHPLVYSLGYAVGFLIVVLGRQQLFTENTLTAVLPLLHRHNFSLMLRLLRLWGIVLVTNLAGVLIFAVIMAKARVSGPGFEQALAEIAQRGVQGVHLGFGSTLLGAVFAGWLIALMVWLLPVAESARVGIVLILTYLVGLGNFPHIVAGSTEAIYAVLTGLLSPLSYVRDFFVPALIGNVLGGVVLVAVLNHAQAMVGRRH